jgi:hypothetical protein
MADLAEIFRKIVNFLEENNIDYLIIGGIASSTLGYPRLTQDIDICIFIKRKEIKQFLKGIKKAGFLFDEKSVASRIKETGTFQIRHGQLHIDFLIASTEFEKSALHRRQNLKVYDIYAKFPTPEDLILFKIIPARHIDLADIENIAIRHKNKLDKKYLLDWAMKLADEAQDMRIYEDIKKLLE